ncbi:MAG: hypothetical protein HZB67_05080 [Candidatus Aenigmarchaeota archaeon]|nr:hypothetical protein [Candidatus Aenigmarchaeota archaeon]
MKKIISLILLLGFVVVVSGCVGQQTVQEQSKPSIKINSLSYLEPTITTGGWERHDWKVQCGVCHSNGSLFIDESGVTQIPISDWESSCYQFNLDYDITGSNIEVNKCFIQVDSFLGYANLQNNKGTVGRPDVVLRIDEPHRIQVCCDYYQTQSGSSIICGDNYTLPNMC